MKAEGLTVECFHAGKPHEHGWSCYKRDNCRCAKGRAAVTAYAARRRKLKALRLLQPTLVEAIGAQRRLRALMVLGYTATEVAGMLGTSRYAIHNITRGRTKRIQRVHAEAIKRLYDKLWDKPAKPGRNANYAQTHAKRLGYHPPLAWDDDRMDDRTARPKGVGGVRRAA